MARYIYPVDKKGGLACRQADSDWSHVLIPTAPHDSSVTVGAYPFICTRCLITVNPNTGIVISNPADDVRAAQLAAAGVHTEPKSVTEGGIHAS